jgi:hypothetical protein
VKEKNVGLTPNYPEMADNKRPVFLTFTLDEGEWSASHPSFLTPLEKAPVYNE